MESPAIPQGTMFSALGWSLVLSYPELRGLFSAGAIDRDDVRFTCGTKIIQRIMILIQYAAQRHDIRGEHYFLLALEVTLPFSFIQDYNNIQ
jgi:hypothetical protein